MTTMKQVVDITSKVIDKRSTLPILKHVLFDGERAIATDLETTVTLPYATGYHGTVDLDMLNRVLKTKPEKISLNKADITFDGAKLEFKGKPESEFPKIPSGKFRKLGRWDFAKLAALKRYVSKDKLKPSLMGVCLIQGNGEIHAYATDSHRLRKEVWSGGKTKFKIIVPAKPLTWLGKMGEFQVAVNDNHMRLIQGEVTIYIRHIAEKPVDFEAVIPTDFSGSIECDRKELITAIVKANQFANRTTHQVTIDTGKGNINADDIVQNTKFNVTLPEFKRNKGSIEVGLNADYLESVLRGLHGDRVTWQYGTPVSANIFRGSEDGPDDLSLLMPVRLNG